MTSMASMRPDAKMGLRGSKKNPIDLTEDSPSRRHNGKRKLPSDLANASTSMPNKVRKVASSPGKEEIETNMKEREEKRLRRWRHYAPTAYNIIHDRALTQRMIVLDRQRDNQRSDHPIEIVKMAGTTGNVYTVIIDKTPSCDCPHALQGNQCKHVVYVLCRVLRVRYELQYQLAFISSELREIFHNAPSLPSKQADESERDGHRKSLEGECPICCETWNLENAKEQIVYCKASCGNNIHRQCFDQWAKTKLGEAVTCPYCRAPWEENDPISIKALTKNARISSDGYVNVGSQLGLPQHRHHYSYRDYW